MVATEAIIAIKLIDYLFARLFDRKMSWLGVSVLLFWNPG